MADKESSNEPKVRKVVVDEVVDEQSQSAPAVTRRHSRTWVLTLVAIVIVAYIFLTLIGFWAFRMWADHRGTGLNSQYDTDGSHMMQGRSGFFGERTIMTSQSNSDGLTTTTTNTTYTQTQGVVTAVSGDSIVIAGGGKTQKIMTNGSTTYTNDTKPAVNDTVVVVGTKDGDTITATQVAVYN